MSSSNTPLLDKICLPKDLRTLSEDKLVQAAEELRKATIAAVSVTGGHLGAGLGVVELTIAIHYIFNTPDDRLIWDVGHQAYPHKILTGRRNRIRTLRQKNGLSGFTKRSESIYDPFGGGHSSTSLSAGLGMAVASTLLTEKRHVIAVIGDGAMSAGIAYEAMNNAGALDARLIVVLNDNDMSIASPSGAMRAYLARLVSSTTYRELRDKAKAFGKKLPHFFSEKARRSEEYARGFFTGGTLFEELGFYYIGPIDGHDFNHLLPVLKNVRDYGHGPVLVHTVTRKGNGYPPAEASRDKYHGVDCFDITTGRQKKTGNMLSYTKVFAAALVEEAHHDDKIIAITAAMPGGTGLDFFSKYFPTRVFDVGIAEQHAVTFAAGLAAEGMKPFVAIYSTFLQRSYDQIIHDVSIQNLPVRFAIDRAGIVGADGATHTGSFDICFLTSLPNFVVMAPANKRELVNMVRTAAAYNDGPIAFRYPRESSKEENNLQRGEILPLGKGRLLRTGTTVAILSLGTCLHESLAAANELDSLGFSVTVADARFAKPLDEELVKLLVQNHALLVTIEEGAQNGFAARILHFLALNGLLDCGTKIRNITLPDRYPDHGTRDTILYDAGLSRVGILNTVLSALKCSHNGLH